MSVNSQHKRPTRLHAPKSFCTFLHFPQCPSKWFNYRCGGAAAAPQSFFIKSKNFIDLRLMPSTAAATHNYSHCNSAQHLSENESKKKNTFQSQCSQSNQFNGQRKSFEKFRKNRNDFGGEGMKMHWQIVSNETRLDGARCTLLTVHTIC